MEILELPTTELRVLSRDLEPVSSYQVAFASEHIIKRKVEVEMLKFEVAGITKDIYTKKSLYTTIYKLPPLPFTSSHTHPTSTLPTITHSQRSSLTTRRHRKRMIRISLPRNSPITSHINKLILHHFTHWQRNSNIPQRIRRCVLGSRESNCICCIPRTECSDGA